MANKSAVWVVDGVAIPQDDLYALVHGGVADMPLSLQVRVTATAGRVGQVKGVGDEAALIVVWILARFLNKKEDDSGKRGVR